MNIPFDGKYDTKFTSVVDAFVHMVNESIKINPGTGAALCIQVSGLPVVHVWAGYRNKAADPWEENTVACLFSCTKIFAAIAVLQLVDQGKIALDAPVKQWWPELSCGEKSKITLRHILTHQSGLSAILQPLSEDALYDWDAMIRALEASPLWWSPGTQHGYAPMTYGWLVGELVRRITNQCIARVISDRITSPLKLDFSLGLPDTELSRIAELQRKK